MKNKFALSLLSASIFALAGCSKSCPAQEPMKNEDGCTYVVELEFDANVLPEDSSGGLYTGFVNEDGLPQGYGVMEYNTSTVYDGTWEEGKWNGRCRINWDSGCIYIGEAKDSYMHGRGYMKWTMGDYYYGDWRYGSPNGFGTKYYMIDATAEHDINAYNVYTGEFVDNLKVGKGTMHYSFGAVYDGDWAADVREGYGVQYWEEGCNEVRFEGEFRNDWIDGYGVMFYRDGTVKRGTWSGTNLIQEEI